MRLLFSSLVYGYMVMTMYGCMMMTVLLRVAATGMTVGWG